MILSVWRLPVGWAAGGGICPSTSPTSTPMEWWDRRARSAKVHPHKVLNLFRNIWQSHTPLSKVPLWSFLLLNPSTRTQTKTHLLLHMHDYHQLCKYMKITLENDTLPHTHTCHSVALSARDWAYGSFLRFISVTYDMNVGVWMCDHAQAGVCAPLCVCVFLLYKRYGKPRVWIIQKHLGGYNIWKKMGYRVLR